MITKIFKLYVFLTLALSLISLSSNTDARNQTVIYIVRHAEKDISNPGNKDPELSSEGKQRVGALSKLLKKESISAVFSTKYKRTMQTVAPIAQRNGIPVKSYSEANKEFADLVKTEFLNKKTLIGGHSNTVLDLVRSFGLQPPVDQLTEEDYDLLFTVTISKSGEPTLTIQRYGKAHHQTMIPEVK